MEDYQNLISEEGNKRYITRLENICAGLKIAVSASMIDFGAMNYLHATPSANITLIGFGVLTAVPSVKDIYHATMQDFEELDYDEIDEI